LNPALLKPVITRVTRPYRPREPDVDGMIIALSA
jgi:hypothetical protein